MKSYISACLFLVLLAFSTSSRSAEVVSFTHPTGTTARDQVLRALTCYLVDQAAGNMSLGCLTNSEGFFETKNLPVSAIEGLIAAKVTGSNSFDLQKLRDWSNTWSYGLRNRRLQVAIITDSLSNLRTNTNYKSWPQEIITRSSAKQKTRVIYRSPWPQPLALSVAETYDSTVGDLTAPILETEIAMDRTDGSGNADFYSYNSAGQLSTTSMFPGGLRQVPGICMGCHYSAETKTFRRDAP